MKRAGSDLTKSTNDKKLKINELGETQKMPKNLEDYLPLNGNSFIRAAEEGDLKMLQFLSDKGIGNQDAVRSAAGVENLDTLKFLVDKLDYCLDEDALIAAIESQNIETLKWIVEEKKYSTVEEISVTLNQDTDPEIFELAKIGIPNTKILIVANEYRPMDLENFEGEDDSSQESTGSELSDVEEESSDGNDFNINGISLKFNALEFANFKRASIEGTTLIGEDVLDIISDEEMLTSC